MDWVVRTEGLLPNVLPLASRWGDPIRDIPTLADLETAPNTSATTIMRNGMLALLTLHISYIGHGLSLILSKWILQSVVPGILPLPHQLSQDARSGIRINDELPNPNHVPYVNKPITRRIRG